MRILMIAPQPFFSPRGTPFSVYFRARSLAELGHDVDLVTYPFGRDVTLPGVRIHRSWKPPLVNKVRIGPSFAKILLDIPLFFKAFGMILRGRYDAVHAHEEAIFFCLAYRLVFWRLKILYDMHSSLPQQIRNFRFSSNPLLIGLLSALERLSIRTSDSVITICPELQRAVERLGTKTPHVLIENTLFDRISLSEPGDDVDEDLIDWRKFEGKRVVLYAGTFEPYQGIPLLLESIVHVRRKRQDAVFVLIGGSPAQLAAMRQKAVDAGVKPFTVFTGNLTPNSVKCVLARADVLVSPRLEGNNTPLKIYEYLASGKPIVATRHETHTQVLTADRAVLTECAPEAFADGICRALGALDETSAPSTSGRDFYESAYGKSIYLQKLEQALKPLRRGRAEQPSPAEPSPAVRR